MKRFLSHTLKDFILITFLILVIIVVATLGYILFLRYYPIQLPLPTGKYKVGRVEYDFIDSGSIDTLSTEQKSKRKFPVWIWYPTNSTNSPNALYFTSKWADALNSYQGMNQLGLHNYTSIRTNAIENAFISNDETQYPILIMEPGLGLSAPDYTVYAENLASQGYIVVGITPTDSADVTGFSDGSIAYQTQKGIISNTNVNSDETRLLTVWSQDTSYTITKLIAINDDSLSMFYHKLNTQKIGIFGHSFGGDTALNVCLKDSRCIAGADLDGDPSGDILNNSEKKPFLFMTHDYLGHCGISCLTIQQVYQQTTNNASIVSIKGTKHLNYSDASIQYSLPIDFDGNFGSIDKLRALSISNFYLSDFFNKNLKSNSRQLQTTSTKRYPEVTFNSHI